MSAVLRLALAVTLVWLMPWQAVRTIRIADGTVAALVDMIAAQHRRYEGTPGAPNSRYLRAVGQPGGEAVPYAGRHLKSVPRRQ